MTAGSYFHHTCRVPTGRSRYVVRESWTMQAARCRTAVEAALPDAAVELYFNLGPSGRHLGNRQHSTPRTPRRAWILGPREEPLLIEKEIRDCDVVGVRLHPGAAKQVLGIPASEVRAVMVDLDVFWGRDVHDIHDRLAATTDPVARLSILEGAIERRLTRHPSPDDSGVSRALCEIVGHPTHESISVIAARTGLSHRRLIALFDETVGLKPKVFQRVHRLRRVFHLADLSPRPSWTAIAHRCGYFDQAHLINDFRSLTGVSPSEYAMTRSSVGHGFIPYLLAPSGAGP